MPAHRILQLNALSTAAAAIGMFAARDALHPLFGLDSPFLLDVLAAGFIVYAAALLTAAQRRPVSRRTLVAFTAADAIWVAGSGIVLLAFWSSLVPLARTLIIAVALIVELFAALQFRAARVGVRSPEAA